MKEIHLDNKSNKIKSLKKIPTGKYNNVRFDIDYGQSTAITGGNDWCPNGSFISTVVFDNISLCQSKCNKSSYVNYGGVCYGGCIGILRIDSVTYSEYLIVAFFSCYINYPGPFNNIGTCESYIADFEWKTSNGFFCSDGFCSPAGYSAESGTYPKYCDIPSGSSSCCPTDNCNAFDCTDANC